MVKKRNLWPLLFVAIFGFTFVMIVWTIIKSNQANLDIDDAFVSSYHAVDENYNQMILQTQKFNLSYDMKIASNQKEIFLDNQDILLRQSAKNKAHQDLFLVGVNKIFILVNDKNSKPVENAKIKSIFTSSTSHNQKQILENFKFIDGKYEIDLKIENPGNYNISGEIIVGNDKAFFFIKSNAVSK